MWKPEVPLENALANLADALGAAGVSDDVPDPIGFFAVWKAWIRLPRVGGDLEEDYQFAARAAPNAYISFGRFAMVYIDDEYDRTETVRCRFDLDGAGAATLAKADIALQDVAEYELQVSSWMAAADLSRMRVAEYSTVQEVM